MRANLNKHKRLTAFLASLVIGVSLIATAQGVQGEMRRFYNIDQGFANSQYVPKFLQGIMVGTTAYTNAQLNAALGGGSGPGIVTVSDTITAGATQTQAGATLLTSTFNNVTVVATAGDGVRLPTAAAGTRVTIRNSDSTDTLKAYPFSGDSINALAVNLSVDIPALSETTFTAKDATVWYSEPTALYLSSPTTLTGGLQIKAAASAGNTTTLITNASQAAARTYTVPDAGANASFVMTAGDQSIAGTKSFTGVLAAGTTGSSPGTIRVYSNTSGYASIVAADTALDNCVLSIGAQTAARTYTIPDWSTKASDDTECSLAGIKVVANTTNRPGALGCLLFATGDSKLYVCTTASATAATWTVVGGQS
jgi:hypothetical protein